MIFVTDYRESWDIRSINGSLCFASAIYARLVGGDQDEPELLWLAEYLRVNSTALAQPEPETAEAGQRGGLPHYPPEAGLQDRLAICIEHELYYGGDHRAAATAIVRDMRLGYLSQPEPEGPTDEQWDAIKDRLWNNYETVGHQGERFMYQGDFDTALDVARQDLARYARPTIKPVPVAERLPGPEDCDEEGRCWWEFEGSDDYEPCWALRKMHGIPFDSTRWLPHHALPIPTTH